VQNIRQLEAALHQEWQQLSQQDIRRLTGGMKRKVAVTYESLDDIYCSKFSTGCNPQLLG
jgi:hypothetical protein